MIYLSAQPDDDYYVWQLRVQLNNFRRLGVEEEAIVLISYIDQINSNILKLEKKSKAKFFYYPDERTEVKYIPSIRPHIIKKFYRDHVDDILKDQDVFYHDSDIIFRELPDWNTLSESNRVSMSDTVSYVGSDYIMSKGEELLNQMCTIVNVDPEIVKSRNIRSGGAQTFIPKIHPLSYAFWDKVENDCEKLFIHMERTKHLFSPTHPIQSWTADMWAVLWNLWREGIQTEIVKELDFSWATSPISEWEKCKIMHNAGVVPQQKNLFYKGEFIKKNPFRADLSYVDKRYCSYMYAAEILDAKKNFK